MSASQIDSVTSFNRLGEACSHIAAVVSCMINATEVRKRSGADSCTSTLCGWNHCAREVSMNDIVLSYTVIRHAFIG